METLKTDVVVMGTGIAGLASAISAREGGAEVMVFEKRKVVGGISVTGMGIFAVESRLQRKKNHPLTKDEAFCFFMERTHWRANARLVRAYIDKTASTIDWFMDMGVEFELLDMYTFPGCFNQTGHLVKSPAVGTRPTATAHLINRMKERAEQLGVKILTETGVKKITRVGGRYIVATEDGSGNAVETDAKSVVIAAGGFSDDKEMLAATGYELGKDLSVTHGIPLTGEGIRMAWELGAVRENMIPQLTGFIASRRTVMTPETMALGMLLGWSLPYLWVNLHGERFIDEGMGNAHYICNAVARQRERRCWVIFDGNTKRRMETEGLDVEGYIVGGGPLDIDALIQGAQQKGSRSFLTADSLADLCNRTGLNLDALQKTVEVYNGYCKKGHDDLFAKNPKYLQPVKSPKFYAFERTLGAYGTVGGIRINEHAQAMDKNDNAIPGLYAAGDCANGAHTYDYSLVYTLWGSTLGFASNTGRLAGEHAALFTKKEKP
jgi:fumarate reductase flavoprotein subunit